MQKNKALVQFPGNTGEVTRKPQGQSNPDHHIWLNNGTWFCHLTVHKADYTKERLRISLGTKSRAEARRRRDLIWRFLRSMHGVTASPSVNAARFLPRHLEHAA